MISAMFVTLRSMPMVVEIVEQSSDADVSF